MHPRLQRILSGEVFAIQFGDAVTICAIGIVLMCIHDARLTLSPLSRCGVYGQAHAEVSYRPHPRCWRHRRRE